ncbi:MAG: hypothetical protein KDC26_02485 [Armatimonadetes bacterium]|nr:hypothetical protein [Armatimonadota bacterium]
MPAKTPLELYRDRMRAVDRRYLLRPMTDSETTETALRVFQAYAGRILAATFPTAILTLSAVTFLTAFVFPNFFATQSEKLSGQIAELILAYGIGLLVVVPLLTIGMAHAIGVVTRYASAFVLGEEPDHPEIASTAWQTLGRMIRMTGAYMLRAFGVSALFSVMFVISGILSEAGVKSFTMDVLVVGFGMLGFFGGFAAVIYTIFRHSLAIAAFLNEKVSVKDAFKRSKTLSQKHGHINSTDTSIFSSLLTFSFIGLLLWGGMFGGLDLLNDLVHFDTLHNTGVLGMLLQSAIYALPTFLVLWLIPPVWASYQAVLYFRRRVEIEAMDIHVLTDDVRASKRSRA